MADVIVPTPHNVTELVSEKPVSEMKKEQPEPAEVHPNVVPAKAEVPIIKSLEESEPEKLYTKKDGTKVPETQYALKLGEKYKVLGPTTISLKDIEEQLAKGVEGAVRVPIGSLFKDEKDIGRFTLAQRTVCKTNDVDPNDPYNYINAMTMKGLAQAKSDKKECIKETFFENVNETIKSSLAGVHIPKTVEEIQKIVRDAAAKKQKVRVVGAGHSWTPVFPEDGSILVSLFDYKGGITSDLKGKEEDWTITFKAGERIKDVQEYCEPHGINIPTNVVMDHVGYGGLVSMGCHGTGWNIQTISDQCVGLKLVDAHGEIREFSRKKDGDRIWSAMVTNLGLFGIVFEYTLKVCKNFNVFIYDYKIQSRDLFGPGGEGAFRDLVVNKHSSQIFWMPFNDQLWLKLFEVTDKPVTVKPIKYVWDSFTNWLSMNLGVPLDNLTTKSTELTPLFLKAGFASFMDNKDHPRVESIYNAIHWEQSLDALKIMCMEFAFPIRENHLEDWANIAKCVRFVQKRVYELSQKKIFPLNLALEMRFIKDSDGLLSTAHGNEHTCFIEIVTSIDAPIWTEFSGEIALKWLKIFPNARPHWAKMCQQVPGIEKVIRTNYGENITKFVEIRNELKVDPHDMFYTQWLGNILEPERFQPYINNVPRVTRGDVDDVAKIGSKEEEEKKKSSKKEKKNEGCKCVLS